MSAGWYGLTEVINHDLLLKWLCANFSDYTIQVQKYYWHKVSDPI